ncbi:PhzF family phenazine biosynthesis protein [Litoribrevibacter albus]|uniref:Phenazine biosynthesis protein PhzF n=1 Tax=Litoribrevibacter albus TaxID=1473156 RepID=A0AA37SFX6_9GAMM|nr:PhzF family phenazine biosynthesis protein [Litoribrevibacter albus]GLQ33606.1 phenazine biosynthesis protein PhzF [Litoribrevibacter albus]
MKVNVAILNAFVDDNRGGNPAGVVLNADELTNEQKLNIAKQVGLSETAFVSKSDVADFKLDFFTPQMQIAHCGHATIATFSYLSQQGLIPSPNTSKETIDGVRQIEVKGDVAYMEQLAPKYTDPVGDHDRILTSLGLSDDASQEKILAKPVIANTGNGFLVVGVNNIEQLEAIQPNQPEIDAISEKYDLIGYYVFTTETNVPGRDASTRMFAPRYGIQEESATGMAAGPLVCYLHDYLNMDKDHFVIEQGYAMTPASPSCLDARLSRKAGAIQSLIVGGVGMASRFETVEV